MTNAEQNSEQTRPSRRIPLLISGVAVVGLAVLLGLGLTGRLPFGSPSFNGILMQSPDPVPDFELAAANGQRVKLSDFRDKLVLLYFGYTFCPDVCPTTLNEVKKAYQQLGDAAEDVSVIMVTVDPERDTPQVLAEYLSYFDPSFIGLSGTTEEIVAAGTPLGLYFAKDEGSAATGYLVSHTSSLFLIDQDGYLRLVYSYGTPADDIAEDLKRLR